MQNMRRRLQTLERIPQYQPSPISLQQIRTVVMRSLSDEDLELLRVRSVKKAAGMPPSELSQPKRPHALPGGPCLIRKL